MPTSQERQEPSVPSVNKNRMQVANENDLNFTVSQTRTSPQPVLWPQLARQNQRSEKRKKKKKSSTTTNSVVALIQDAEQSRIPAQARYTDRANFPT